MKIVVIIGAGPAGLGAAYELVQKSDIRPIIIESDSQVGGISKTVAYNGNRIDIGGHRFFSKSKRITDFWQEILPLERRADNAGPDPEKVDKVMLLRRRLSRIFFLRKFFSYPVDLSFNTLKNLGIVRTARIIFSYLQIRLWPIKNEKSLADFFSNRFGRELYLTFFKDYTEKLWGVSCSEIKPEWGAQRIKGLSITEAMRHIFKNGLIFKFLFKQNKTETSLIDSFWYPKLGPGQMYETVAEIIKNKGGEINLNQQVVGLERSGQAITGVKIKNLLTGEVFFRPVDYVISSMPIQDLIVNLTPAAPDNILAVARGLCYRDFITVGLLLNKLKIKNETKIKTFNNLIPDNWIYIQEKEVKVGRLQIFNNWSPYLVKNKNNVWLGMEYFGNFNDDLFSKNDEEFKKFAIDELAKIDIINQEDVLDSCIIRTAKAYPAYFGAYDRFNEIKDFVNNFKNLFLIGRNGMHRYNNMDHSILSGFTAADNIINDISDKNNLWNINTEEEYHESE
ncbi:MAG: NAD(P)/FAD-dependent oxidoreductase [Patescibacteria group bacterium]|jgi:protoporphyrinogen oxidase